jgi:hypothetical protein
VDVQEYAMNEKIKQRNSVAVPTDLPLLTASEAHIPEGKPDLSTISTLSGTRKNISSGTCADSFHGSRIAL